MILVGFDAAVPIRENAGSRRRIGWDSCRENLRQEQEETEPGAGHQT
jgi:hypothetical protein